MKKVIIIFSVICSAVALISCNNGKLSMDKDSVRVSFSLRSSQTKSVGMESDSTGTAGEKTINELCFFAYNDEGNLVKAKYSKSDTAVYMTIKEGTYDFYVIANGGDLVNNAKVKNVDGLKTIEAKNLSDTSALHNFVMRGSVLDKNVDADNKEVKFDIYRCASKIVVRKIINNLPGSQDIVLEGIYLRNVVTNTVIVGDEMPSTPEVVNTDGSLENISDKAWFGDKLQDAYTISYGNSYSTAHTFYACANNTTEDKGKTALMIKTKINDIDYYYKLKFNKQLSALACNKFFDITSIKISELGDKDPDDPDPSKENITFEVIVADWVTETTSYEFK